MWASTPLMKMGTGRRPCASISAMSSGTYAWLVMTCLRYSSTATTGAPVPRSGPSREYHSRYSAGVAK